MRNKGGGDQQNKKERKERERPTHKEELLRIVIFYWLIKCQTFLGSYK